MSVSVLVARLVALAGQDAELRAVLRGVAGEFLRLTEPPLAAPESDGKMASASALAEPLPAMEEPRVPAAPTHVALSSSPGIEIPIELARRLVTKENDLPYRGPLPAQGGGVPLGGLRGSGASATGHRSTRKSSPKTAKSSPRRSRCPTASCG